MTEHFFQIPELVINLLDQAERTKQEQEFIQLASEINKIKFILGKTGVNKDSCENVIRYIDSEVQELQRTINILIDYYKTQYPEDFDKTYGVSK
jgi:hypothetical protein